MYLYESYSQTNAFHLVVYVPMGCALDCLLESLSLFLSLSRSDVEEGGETVFPAAKGNFSSVSWWNELSECGKKGLSVKPKKGDALLFWSMNPDATPDPSSLHGQLFI